MVARLQKNRMEREIREMEDGETGFTVPWAMSVLGDGSAFLNERYTIHKSPGGTVDMFVMRKDGRYIVDIGKSRHQWSRSSYSPGSSWFAIPVSEIVG